MREKSKWLALFTILVALIIIGIFTNKEVGIKNVDASILDIYNGDIDTNWGAFNTYDIDLEDSYTITKSGIYHFTGTIEDGSIVIDTDRRSSVKIILDNTSIKNSSGPAINCYEADNLAIEFTGNNYLEDGDIYSEAFNEDIEGVIYSKADLSLSGDGIVTITSNYKDAIVGKDDLVIRGGTYNVKAIDDAIRGKDSVHITGGIFNITANGDGIKTTNNSLASKGFVYIEDGTINMSVGDDGIHAENYFIIDSGKIEIAKSYEGLEGIKITINGGDISIKSSDDSINAGNGTSESNTPRPDGMMDADEDCILTINDGNIYINASGDGIDSNGYVYINGGNIVVDGPINNGNGALDAGLGFIINGGKAIAVGSSGMAENFGNKSTINNVSVYLNESQESGTTIAIKDQHNNTIFSHTSAKSFSHIAAASDEFALGNTYILYIDGKEYTQFSINNTTTIVGNRTNGGPKNRQPASNSYH